MTVFSGEVFVIDPHAIYRSGVVSIVEAMPEATSVGQAGSVEEALADPALPEASAVILDHDLPGAVALIARLHRAAGAPVIVCSSRCGEEDVLEALGAGARGFLSKETLTPEGLRTALRAAVNGTSVVAPDLLGAMLGARARELAEPGGAVALTDRELRVLRLVADGKPTREVAGTLAYSERTVKNVLHDVATKLGARSRSQAVAAAMRRGLI